MSDPVTFFTTAATVLSAGSSVVSAVRGGPDTPPVQRAETPDVEQAKRNAADRQRERLRAVASQGQSGTQLTGSQGIQSSGEDSTPRTRKTLLGV